MLIYRPNKQSVALIVAMTWLFAASCSRHTWSARFVEAEETLTESGSPEERFYVLGEAAKAAYEVGSLEKAQSYATELARMAPQFRSNWNYGNAVHDANLVLGRLALHRGAAATAVSYLERAGETPGSPQLNSFGPNMSLASDLLRQGHTVPVLAYFKKCKRFWRMERGRLAEWSALAKDGVQPDFGANLVY